LLRFAEAIDRWIERESPSDDMRLRVVDWVWGRHDGPYGGMRREDHPYLWFGAVPGTEVKRTVVTCSYKERERFGQSRSGPLPGELIQPEVKHNGRHRG
jgi:hypothetical protein